MLVKEYRIPFPATLEEYRIGMLYMVERATVEENSQRKNAKSQFVTEVKRERYYDEERGLHGIYTEKVCHIRSLLPTFIKIFLPESSSILVEKAWNSFPDRCLTMYECPFFGDSFHLSIESRFVADDNGYNYKNPVNLTEQELNDRQVVNLNIASEEHLRMTKETNVQQLKSEKKTNIPVLDEDGIWIREADQIMCVYKVARLHVSKLGIPGSRIEKWGHKHGLQIAFLRSHRKQLCWIDSWLGLNVNDVDGMNDGWSPEKQKKQNDDSQFNLGLGRRRSNTPKFMDNVASALSSDGGGMSAEYHAGLAFAFSDETNPFFT